MENEYQTKDMQVHHRQKWKHQNQVEWENLNIWKTVTFLKKVDYFYLTGKADNADTDQWKMQKLGLKKVSGNAS